MAVRWKILLLICAASFVSYVLRTNLSIVGETMIKDLGLTQIQLGIIFSAFAWGYAIFQFPGGVFGDVAGSRKAVTIIAILWGLLTILTGIVPGRSVATPATILTILIVVRFLVGVSQAPIFPVIGGAIANWFPVSSWGLPNGLTSTALTLGAAAAAPLLVLLMKVYGWRESFFITAPLAFLIAAVWWRYVRDQPADHPSISAKELELIHANRQAQVEEKGVWKRTLKDRNVLLLGASYFCTNYVFYLFFNWFFFYLVDVRRFGEEQAGYFTSAQWIVGAVGATLGGFLCDHFVKRYGARNGYRLVPIPSMILGGLFLLIGSVESGPVAAVALLSLSFGCTQLTEGSYWSAIASVAGKHASSAGGVLNTGGNAVGGIGAVLVPITAERFGWPAAMFTGSIFAFAAAVLWFFIRADVAMAQDPSARSAKIVE
ncbi:MFS transporter [bacterium]|nr:MFS transporter [bacterium]MCI0603868.1 MFS transporter [bacterium]